MLNIAQIFTYWLNRIYHFQYIPDNKKIYSNCYTCSIYGCCCHCWWQLPLSLDLQLQNSRLPTFMNGNLRLNGFHQCPSICSIHLISKWLGLSIGLGICSPNCIITRCPRHCIKLFSNCFIEMWLFFFLLWHDGFMYLKGHYCEKYCILITCMWSILCNGMVSTNGFLVFLLWQKLYIEHRSCNIM